MALKTSTKLLAGAAALTGAALTIRWQMRRWFAESPRAVRLKTLAPHIELRRYEAMVVAGTVLATGDERARVAARARLGAFLVGKNHARDDAAPPRALSRRARRETFASTTPVLELSSREHPEARRALCVAMPAGREISSLPIPDDERILLEDVPARVLGVLSWRGNNDDETVRDRAETLLATLTGAGYQVKNGTVIAASYDPPTTLRSLRHNEVWMEVVLPERPDE